MDAQTLSPMSQTIETGYRRPSVKFHKYIQPSFGIQAINKTLKYVSSGENSTSKINHFSQKEFFTMDFIRTKGAKPRE